MSYYFEDYKISQTATSVGRTITESDIVTFAGLSGDFNPLHTDAEFAKASLYGRRIAHGMLIQAIATGLATRTGFIEHTAIGFRELSCKFVAPVHIGDTVRVTMEVIETKLIRRANVGNITLKFNVLTHEDTIVQRGKWQVIVKTRA